MIPVLRDLKELIEETHSVSPSTQKAHRNLLIVASTILLIHWYDVPIHELSLLGVKASENFWGAVALSINTYSMLALTVVYYIDCRGHSDPRQNEMTLGLIEAFEKELEKFSGELVSSEDTKITVQTEEEQALRKGLEKIRLQRAMFNESIDRRNARLNDTWFYVAPISIGFYAETILLGDALSKHFQ